MQLCKKFTKNNSNNSFRTQMTNKIAKATTKLNLQLKLKQKAKSKHMNLDMKSCNKNQQI